MTCHGTGALPRKGLAMESRSPRGFGRLRHKPQRMWGFRGVILAAAALAGVGVLAACGSSASSSGAPATGAVKSGGSITFALDEDVAGFNPLLAGDTEFVLAEIQDQTLPKVFVVAPNLKPVLNTNVVTSATVTNTNPQTIVYQINPKATWSDGTPISAADFVYAWQSQSGNPKYKDVGGKAFLPASTSGYNQIASVTGSNNGKTVTVVMAKPFGDWQSMFSQTNPLLPAHVLQSVGFNTGLQSFSSAVQVSGGPYEIQSYTKGEDLVEVRNPHYWGTPGKLSKIVFRFILDDSQAPPAVQNGEVNIVNPALASVAFNDSVRGIPNFNVAVDPGLEFQHIDFNEANPYLALASIRHAIAYGTNRQEMVTRIVSPLSLSIQPLENRVFMPTQPQYQNTSGSYGAYNPAEAETLLKQAGMTMGPDGYFHPNFGPEKGQDFTLSISTTSGVPVRAQIEQLFQADMKSIGVKINIQNYDANTLFGTVGPKGEFDIIEFAWVQSPFPSANQSIYCSYTNAADCGDNWDHYADPKLDSLMSRALTTIDSTAAAGLYNQADALLWKDMATLPLFQQPNLYGWSSSYENLVPNTSNVGIPWNAQQWGMR
jgi:peptide/nickel transport system substrate-binding protein